jgi:exodeoxyribonuclease VII small subunit
MSNPSELFSKQLEELESIVKKMESESLPLETCLDLYSKGVDLTKRCHAILNEAEKKIQALSDYENLD